jgi:uncharacterized membrane protein
MTRNLLACVLIITLLLTSASATSAGDGGNDRFSDDELEVIDGTKWTKDIRITRNSADDNLPQIVVDDSEIAHIIWQRAGYWTLAFDKRGQRLTKEVFITPHVVRGYGSPVRYPLGPQIAIDSNAYIHVVWDDGYNNVYYQKFDPDGNSISGEIQLGVNDALASHVPSVAIDPINDNVHIVHEDYLYQCEDILYSKLDNNGKVLVNQISVSADISSHCEHSTLTTDSQGYVHVAFGSQTGPWWRKVDQKGVAQGTSVSVKGPPAFMVPDMAVTPNGDVHLVWTWNGTVHYTRLDNNGTKLDVNVTVSKKGVDPGPPRIAAANNENTVHIVWHDLRDGNPEIYYANMENGSYNQTPDNIRLTKDSAYSLYPGVAVSPRDSVHVVWQDNREGNTEIYYKFQFNAKMDLGVVNIAELANVYFFHPDETKTLNMYIKNLGLLSDDYEVTLTTDEWAEARGWSFYLNETRFPGVAGNATVFFHLTQTSPAEAFPGDYINVSITATSASGETESLAWRSFIIVEKAVTVVCSKPTKVITAGGDVFYNLNIANIGDVPDSYKIDYTLIPEDDGWTVEVDKAMVTLDVDESTNFTVHLIAPEDAEANDTGTVFVRVQSMSDASVWDGKKLLGIVDPDIHLELTTVALNLYIDPAGSVDFPITVGNAGTMQGKLTFFLTSTDPRPGWSALLDRETIFLAGGEEQVVTLTVRAPADALAGSRQVITVSIETDGFMSQSSIDVTAVVKQVHGLTPYLDTNGVAVYPGEEGMFIISIVNEGNGNEHVTLGSALVPSGWSVIFEVDGFETQDLTISAKLSKSVVVRVSTSLDAAAVRLLPIHVVLTDSVGGSYIVTLPMNVHTIYGVDLSAPSPQGMGAPSGTIAYNLVVHNMGNAEDTFLLETDALPGTDWTAEYYDEDGEPVSSVILDGGEKRDIELRVHIPDDADMIEPMDIFARATSTSAESDEVKLILELAMADLKISTVDYDPPIRAANRHTGITVEITNDGSSTAKNVTVVMLVDNKEWGRTIFETVEPDYNYSITFEWVPSPGKYTLTYRVFSDSKETEYDNNELDHVKTVEGDPPNQAGFGMLLVLMAIACLVIIARVRRRE